MQGHQAVGGVIHGKPGVLQKGADGFRELLVVLNQENVAAEFAHPRVIVMRITRYGRESHVNCL